MISLPTTALGEVWRGVETGHHQHPHHTRIRGCGGVVWRSKSHFCRVGKSPVLTPRPRLKIHAGCRLMMREHHYRPHPV
jgi:hypothetical protein